MSEPVRRAIVENTPTTEPSEEPAMTHDAHPRRLPRLRRLSALATGTWLGRGYLAVFGASVPAVFLFPDSPVAAAPMLLTAPWSFFAMALPFGPGTDGGGAAQVLALTFTAAWLLLAAFVNAAVLGALTARQGAAALGTRTAGPRPHRLRDLLAPAVDNWLARGYLAVVAAALGFCFYAVHLSPDPGFAGIWPLMTTAPFSLLAVLAMPTGDSWLTSLIFFTGTAAAGLLNAVLLGRLARRVGTGEPHPAA
ncbi:SCO4225 family membrane protein [Streptomyces sp. TRM68416]|uniref:SCO4225 family membrane protein n=1 Tax=Streptomyces sp. TRM68416 TaxID=2758412 RepID=UPI001CB6E20C|nr:hypothetical protein [Streptomyces sp. TRM68416]